MSSDATLNDTSLHDLQRSALETSVAILRRQRRADLELQKVKADLEALSAQQRQSLALLNATLDASPDGIVAVSVDGELVAFNRNFKQMWQLPAALCEGSDPVKVWLHCSELVKDTRLFANGIPQFLFGPQQELTFKDGRIFEQYVCTQWVDGAPSGVVVQWHDITERRRADVLRNRMTHILERSLNEVYLFDHQTLQFTYANSGALKNLGYDLVTLQTLTPVDIKPEYDEAMFRRMVQPLLERSTELLIFETVHRRANGTDYNVQVHLQLDNDFESPLFMALILDITERKRSDEIIWTQANFDNLTRLPNRSMLQDRLAQEILKAQRNHYKLALLFLDLDKFKEVNDTLGHPKGDLLLIAAARRIRQCVRAADTVARLGGDEFVVLLTALHDGRMASDIASNLLTALSTPFDLGGSEVVISASIGITLFPDDAQEIDGLFRNADQAMYVSKGRGRNQFSYFTAELEVSAQRRMRLLGQLRHALSLNQFFLHFQPIVEIRTGRMLKAEALIRWQHPELGLVSPSEFIPLAEESGLIVDIGNWVFDEAARWVKLWRERFSIDFQISVNKSPVQFNRERGKPGSWTGKLDRLGLPGSAIAMEITESVLIEPNADLQQTLLAYRDAGIQVAIDDFGTGYSSLSYLKQFDIDYLKIDQSFIRNLAPGSSDLALSQAIIVMAHALGLKVIAEGVETQQQFDLLAQAGCDYVQGYLLSRPVSPAAIEQMLQA